MTRIVAVFGGHPCSWCGRGRDWGVDLCRRCALINNTRRQHADALRRGWRPRENSADEA